MSSVAPAARAHHHAAARRTLASPHPFRYVQPRMAQDRTDADLMLLAALRERVRGIDTRVEALGRHL